MAAARKPSVEPRARAEPLQLDQDPRFQRRQWIFERTGWAVLERDGRISVMPAAGEEG